MSAFRRRTVFAAPIIVAAACSGGKESPKRYPGTTYYVTPNGPDECWAGETGIECPPNTMCNPPSPPPIRCPAFPDGKTEGYVVKRANGECAILPDGCFDDSCLGPSTDCPLRHGQKPPPKKAAP